MGAVPQLSLDAYSGELRLYEPFEREYRPLSEQERVGIIDTLLEYLGVKESKINQSDIPEAYEQKRKLLRALLTIRAPKAIDNALLQQLNTLLQFEAYEKGIVRPEHFTQSNDNDSFVQVRGQHTELILWQGDITRLGVDAIVNAANPQMLGCFQPTHLCIDNVIHAAAGPQLRADCQIIMDKQQALEITGDAKITRAYNLPSRFVIHTVGPIFSNDAHLLEQHKADLASSYTSCLNLASQIEQLRSIAFCCISTGLYGFPKLSAAEIAVRTVEKWLKANPDRLASIVFNVFDKGDCEIYARLFEARVD